MNSQFLCGLSLLRFSLLFYPLEAGNIKIISIIIGGHPFYQYEVIAPTYDIAFADAEVAFPGVFAGVTRKSIFRLGRSTCDDEFQSLHAVMGDIMTMLHDTDHDDLTILQTPGCSQTAVALGDFARELNLPLLLTTAGGAVFLDRARFPTVLALAYSDHSSMCDGAVAMLEAHNWTTVTLLCGSLYRFASPVSVIGCQTLEKRLLEMPQTYDTNKIVFDPERNDTYEEILGRARNQSRVILIYTDIGFLKAIMIKASTLHMTNGEFIFLALQAFSTPSIRPWPSDEITRAFSKSLIIYSNVPPNWAIWNETFQRIKAKARASYNVTSFVTPGLPDVYASILNIPAYEGVFCLAHFLHDLQRSNRTDLLHIRHANSRGISTRTRDLLRQFENRTFHLASGSVLLNQFNYRRIDTLFMRLNNVTMNYEPGWFYDVSVDSGTLHRTPIADAWLDSKGPPKNRPACGFRLNQCPLSNIKTLTAVGVTVFFGGLMGATVIIGCLVPTMRRYGLLPESEEVWLQIDTLQVTCWHVPRTSTVPNYASLP
ncbi:hypothetical protein BV898_02558 [Hypsibius exemplaris]|uniref:Receptor ligand binding region domain-containing protein n=1 Tax=Hypsibius exemplaris TaxID=2072580 RepID=A0A1W0X7A4_HYPEX|nr:hypothetical protein BV898_02558 [Hypsibius exemplaris]